MEKLVNILSERYGENEPILLCEIISLCPDVTEDAVYRRIRRAVSEGRLAKKARGVYYIPTATRFGPSVISDDAVLAKKYLGSGEFVYGYVSGLSLQNAVGVSDQEPGTLEIVTNAEKTRRRSIGPSGGYKDVVLRKPRVPVTSENVDALRALDLALSVDEADLNEYERRNLSAALRKAGRTAIAQLASYYPSKASKRILEWDAHGLFA